MEARRAEHTNRTRVGGRDVADVRREAVARVESVEAPHHSVPDHLRHDRGGRDGRTASVTVDERSMRWCSRAETEPVDETGVCGRMEVGEHRSQRRQIGAVEPGAIDLGSGDHADADPRRTADDRVEELLAFFVPYLFGVVQSRQRPNPHTAQILKVEEDPSDHERSGKGAATRLIRACDVADAEAPIVGEKPLTARAGHPAEDRR